MSNETCCGDIVVYNRTIIEPMTNCVIARNFPTDEAAMAAARAMNEVADWHGIIKTLARKQRPNCQDELERIAAAHGGELSRNAIASSALPFIQAVADQLDRGH
jgi:hypothetical protein